MKNTLLIILCLVFIVRAGSPAKQHPLSHNKNTNTHEIVFLANLNGVLENCRCGNPSLGGLDRIATIVKNYRKTNSRLLFIDGGDFFNTYPFSVLNKKVVAGYAELSPDIIVLGDQEFIEGKKFLIESLSKLHPGAVLSSNLTLQNQEFPDHRSFNWGTDDALIILSYVDEHSFSYADDENVPSFSEKKFKQAYAAVRGKGLLIVVFHGEYPDLKKFIKIYPDIDLILTGHTQQSGVLSRKRPFIVGGGLDGEHLMRIKINLKKGNQKFTVDAIPIDLGIVPEEQVHKIVSEKIK